MDGSWLEDKQASGLGWIFQRKGTNDNLRVIDQGAQAESHVNSPIMAEALAMRLALFKARERGIAKICCHSDSQVLIEAINTSTPIKEVFGILEDIKTMIPLFLAIDFCYVHRSKNMLTDALAKNVLRTMMSGAPYGLNE